MKITTPTGILEGENIEAILKKYGLNCLRGANLRHANLLGADLRHACLLGADLRYAELCGADLRGADLCGADLFCANLRGADLCGADLCDANLYGACLLGADLRNAELCGANLSELTVAQTSILPDEGDIIGWKKAWTDNEMPPTVIVKLLIPSDAQRLNATGRKCRASTARVLDLQDRQGNSLPARHHGIQFIRPRLHLQKRRNRARRRLRYKPVERMRPRHPLLHHPHRSRRILGDSK